ncbi:hypothetical protein B5M09_002920 [Aphanomyces astaci]|uniref:YHYH domain-containing protein n=1 Tax=Aphanomyces astaci TaxID=112090 RepID=A0A3R8DFJ2_APHAT|nr:hypothetical protein B5M09_002920 [Aphanomyces astaci]
MLQFVTGDLAVPRPNVINSIGSVDALQSIPLLADIVIPDGRELFIPIHIPAVALAINANGPAKVNKVSSLHANGLFGVGEVIDIDIQFTSAVDVVGTPSLRMRTGCNTPSCRIKEIQSITCSATSGKFAVSFQGQTVSNIPFNASPLKLTNYLLRLTSISAIQVTFADAGTQACTFYGTKITIQFDQVNFVSPTADGNLPSLTTDPLNLHGDTIALAHHTRSVVLTPVAIEVQKGVAPTDRDAVFVGFRTPSTLIFRYIVAYGDLSQDLDYTAPDALALNTGGSIFNAGTFIPASLTLPVPGQLPAWPTGMVSSLGVNNAIALNSNIPVITSVATPTKPDGIYGQGELIEIKLTFSLPVTVVGAPVLLLATGQNVANAPVVRVESGNTVLVAQYVVNAGDFSLDLTYVDATSFILNAGDSVLRQSTTSTMPVNMTLPPNGLPGSLFNLANIVIDTTPPYIMTVSSVLPDGVYTTGDILVFSMVFSRPVYVTGTPQFQLATGSIDLCPGWFVVRVPTDGNSNVFLFPEAVDWRWLSPGSHLVRLTLQLMGLIFVVIGYFVVIAGRTYTVASVSGYKVTMVEAYVGVAVNLGTNPMSPQLSIFTRGFQYAVYTSGSTTSTLQFSYQVQHGDTSLDLAAASDVLLPTSTSSILRLSTTPTTPANLAMPIAGSAGSLVVASQLVVNTDPATVLSISSPTRSGVYVAGSIIAIAVQFTQPVVVVGPSAPGLLTNVGENRFAIYVSGSGTSTLVFQLTVAPSDSAAAVAPLSRDAMRMPNVFTSIRRKSMNPLDSAVLTLPPSAMTLGATVLVVNPMAAVVSQLVMESPVWPISSLKTGDAVIIAVTFTEPVTVSGGSPVLDLTVGKPATYVSGSTTTKLLFQYIVQYGDQVPAFDVVSPDAIRLNGAAIVAVNGGASASVQLFSQLVLLMSNTLPPPQPIPVDPSPFRVTAVQSWSIDGTYTVGDSLLLAVTFSDAVVATGAPQLALRTGNALGDQVAAFHSADANVVYFVYVVQAGDATTQVVEASTSALQCSNDVGLNANPATDDAIAVSITDWSSQVVVCWSEAGKVQVRVFNNNPSMPLWTLLSGGLNVQTAANCKCSSSGTSQLVCSWEELAAAGGGATVVHVSAMTGTQSTPVWTLLSGSGLNVDLTKSASHVAIASTNVGVVLAWQEVAASSSSTVLQVKFWNGNVGTPVWTAVDVSPLMSTTSNHQEAQIFYFNSRLTLVWTEVVTATRYKVRVAAWVTGATSYWTLLDGNGAGLNAATRLASKPTWAVCSAKLYIAWQDSDTLRVQVYNSAANTWAYIDGGEGLQTSSTGVGFASLACTLNGLMAAWQEIVVSSGVTLNRAVSYTAATNSWSSPTGIVMDNPLKSATSTGPALARSSQSMYIAWTERHAVNFKAQVHVALFTPDTNSWLSMTYSCLKRPGTGFAVPYALTLPGLFSQASLGDTAKLQLDTSPPVVLSITPLSPPGLYRGKDSVQSIALISTGGSSSSVVTGGGFALGYNSVVSACIAWNAAAMDVQNTINSMAGLGLAVSVTKDSAAFQHGGVQFKVTFTTPASGVHPLSVEPNGCPALMCANGIVCGKVVVNTDKALPLSLQPGYVDFEVMFSAPVQVTSGGVTPVLTLSNGVTATYASGAIVQVIDVGVSSPSMVLAGGFALLYGGVPTACINVDAKADGSSFASLRYRLMELPTIATIGIASIRSRVFQNGVRHVIHFQPGTPLPLTYAPGISCAPLVGVIQTIDLVTTAAVTGGSFTVALGALASATCLPVLTASAGQMQAALNALTNNEVMVTVEKHPIPTGGFRFAVTFPNAHSAQATPLTATTTGCTALTCPGGACSLAVNADYTVEVARTPSLVFRYVVQAGDIVPAVGYVSLTGDIVQRTASWPSSSAVTPAILTLPTTLPPSGIQIDTLSTPTVMSVTSTTPNGVYSQGDRIDIVLTFSQIVHVTGRPISLQLNSNGVAVYSAGSGTASVTFQYTVAAGDTAVDLDCFSTSSLQFLTPGGGINYRDPTTQALTPISTTLPIGSAANSLATLSSIVIDAVVPSIVSVVSTKPSGTYGTGEGIDFVVEFTHPVVITGTPSIALNSGGSAMFTLGGTRQLLDIGVTSAVTSGQFAVWYGDVLTECINFNDVVMLRSKLLDVPGIGAIGLTSVTTAAFGRGQRVTIVFTSTDAHTAPLELVPVVPQHCLPLSPPTSSNSLLVGRGLDQLVTFRYTVAVSDTAAVFAVTSPAIALNAGTVRRRSDRPSIDVNLALPALPATLNAIHIQGGIPSIVQAAMVTAGGTYGVGYPPVASPAYVKPGQIVFTLTFSMEVVFIGAVTIQLNTGKRAVLYAQLSPVQFAFVYTIELGDASVNLDFASVDAVVGTIMGRSTTNSQRANTLLPLLQLSGVNVVTVDPNLPAAIQSVTTSHPDGTIGSGERVIIQSTFGRPTTVLSGLNHNPLQSAMFPSVTGIQGDVYMSWSEQTSATTSVVYVAQVDNQAGFTELSPPGAGMNRLAGSNAVKSSVLVQDGFLYAAWDENGIINVAQFSGNVVTKAWTSLPFMGTNAAATNPVLATYMNTLFVVWKEGQINFHTEQSANIRVASYDSSLAPPWRFYDTAQGKVGLNLDRATDPHILAFAGHLYVAWAEFTGACFEIQVYALALNTMTFEKIPQVGYVSPTFVTSFGPVLFANTATNQLMVQWYTYPAASVQPTMHTGVVTPQYWKEIVGGAPMPGASPDVVTCSGHMVVTWTLQTDHAMQVFAGRLDAAGGISQIHTINHNMNQDASSPKLACVSSVGDVALLWTEYDGFSYKLRQSTLSGGRGEQWMPHVAGLATLVLTNGLVAVNTDLSGTCARSLTYELVVPPNTPAIQHLNAVSVSVNRARIQDCTSAQVANTVLFPLATDMRSLAYTSNIAVDTSVPFVLDVSTTAASNTYGAGEIIPVVVTFSAAVTVSPSGLHGESPAWMVFQSRTASIDGLHEHKALYSAGNNTNTLTFLYTTLPTDTFALFDYMLPTSLQVDAVAGAWIRRQATYPTTDAVLTLPIPGHGHSLSRWFIAVDTTPPNVLDVTATNADGTYFPGDVIHIVVTFSLPVIVTLLEEAPPVITLALSTQPIANPSLQSTATYVSGSGTTHLTFEYVVQPLDETPLLSLFDDRPTGVGSFVKALDAPVNSIYRLASIPSTLATLECPAPGTLHSMHQNIGLDSTVPTIVGMSTTIPDGTYDIDAIVPIQISFSAPVVVTGVPLLLLNVHSDATRGATYQSGSGTTSLVFLYRVQLGDEAWPLDHLNTNAMQLKMPLRVNPLQDPPFATVNRLSSHPILPADLTLPPLGPPPQINTPRNLIRAGHIINIRTDGVRVSQVEAAANNVVRGGTVAAGHVLELFVHFTQHVFVTGTPQLSLNVPSRATYVSGSGTEILKFVYVVAPGDVAAALELTSVLLGSSDAVNDVEEVPVPLQLPAIGTPYSLGIRYTIHISAIPPVVQIVEAIGVLPHTVLAAGDVVQLVVLFSVPVVVSGIPQLALNTGQPAVYVAGSGTNSLVFSYVVQAGNAGVLDYASATALTGNIRAQSTTPTTPAILTLAVPGTLTSLSATWSLTLNTTPPTVVDVSFAGLPDQVCTVGMDIPIQIKFSYPVVVAGTLPTLALATKGNVNQNARYVGGSGTSLLHFVYTVQPGDASTALEYTHANALQASMILQFSSSPTVHARLTLPVPGSVGSLSGKSRLTVCMTCPRVVSVTGSPTGVYTAGHTLSIMVTFSEAVQFAPSPVPTTSTTAPVPIPTLNIRLAMAFERVATYTSGSGTATWTFVYPIQISDDVYPVEVANMYALYGAQVVSVARPTYVASLRLPSVGQLNSLSATSSIRIDTSPPTVVQVTTPVPDGEYGPGHVIAIDVAFSVPVVVTGTPVLHLAVLPTPQAATYEATAGATSSVVRFTYVVQPGDSVFRLDYMRVCSDRGFFDDVEGYDPTESSLPCLPLGTISALDLNGGSIKAAATIPMVDANVALPAVSPWPAMRYLRSDYSVAYNKTVSQTIPQQPSERSVCAFDQEDRQFHILSNGVPNHVAPMGFVPAAYMFELPRFPTMTWTRDRPVGLVGVMLNGIPFNNSIESVSTGGDLCDGYPLYKQSATSPIVLDECNGVYGPDGVYRYYLNPASIESTGTFIPCFKGYVPMHLGRAVAVDYTFVGGIEGFTPINLQDLVVFPQNRENSIWLNAASVSVTTTATTVIVSSTGLPDGPLGLFPNALNSNSVLPQNYQFRIPRSPVKAGTRTPLPSGAAIGVLLNGIPLYNTIDTDGNSLLDPRIVRHLVLDKCNGYVDATGAYRYYAPPDCLLDALNERPGDPSPLIGFAFDGFPIYGRFDESGNVPTDLDRCNGRTNQAGMYQYHVTDSPPYTLGCFTGVVPPSTLPFYRSLATSSAISIKSSPPYIVDITTLKAPGSYVAGETIDFRVLWSDPVAVTGAPTLSLAVVHNTTQVAAIATYDSTTSTPTTTVFLYVVGPQEFIADLSVQSPTALQLPTAATSIKRAATVPTLDAILTCPMATLGSRYLLSLFHSIVWMESSDPNLYITNSIQSVANVQVNLRGLYHPDAQDLAVSLMHNDIRARLFDPIPMSGYHFGRPRDATAWRMDVEDDASSIGADYSFVATNLGVNLALSGIATQSSTFGPTSSANKAIDGIRSAYFSMVSVTGPVAVDGTFQLRVGTCTTPPVSVGAVAMRQDERLFGESFQAKLEACTGQVTVLRSAADRMGGYAWTVTFVEDVGSIALMDVVHATQATLETSVTTLWDSTANVWYSFQTAVPGELYGDTLYPCYVMVFDTLSALTFETVQDALAAAVWSRWVETAQVEATIVLPPHTIGQYIRIQHNSPQYLSVAEVEVYAERYHSLAEYFEGSPVASQAYDSNVVWAPEVSLQLAFGGQSARGDWSLVLQDRRASVAVGTVKDAYPLQGQGGLSEWQLVVTNTAGTTTTHYLPMVATISTIPKYGDLLVDARESETDHLDSEGNAYLDPSEARQYLSTYWPGYLFLDAFVQYRILQDMVDTYALYGRLKVYGQQGQRRWIAETCEGAVCVMPPTHYELYTSMSVAAPQHLLDKTRTVAYVPSPGFVGMDTFTFSTQLNNHDAPGLVRIQVLHCRDPTCVNDLYLAQSSMQPAGS